MRTPTDAELDSLAALEIEHELSRRKFEVATLELQRSCGVTAYHRYNPVAKRWEDLRAGGPPRAG